MSTTINVTVDDGGLPARNKQQVAANRQAYIQTKAAEQSADLGQTQLRLDRAASGLDPRTGEPLIPPSTTSRTLSRFAGAGIPRLDQRPAANRTTTAAPENPLVLDFSTIGSPSIYSVTGVGGDVSRLIRSTGKAKYKNAILGSSYQVVTTGGTGTVRQFSANTSGGPFNQAYVSASATPSSAGNDGYIGISYPGVWMDGNAFSDSVFTSPPYVPPNFIPKFNSPQTIEFDVLYPSSLLEAYVGTELRLTLVSNSILANERQLANAIAWRVFGGSEPPVYGLYLDCFRYSSAPPWTETASNYVDFIIGSSNNGSLNPASGNLDPGGGDLSSQPYKPGWRRLAMSFGNSGIKLYENSNLVYSFNANLKSFFASLPAELAGFTWVPSVNLSFVTNGIGSTPASVSTIKYSNKNIGSTYIPSRLT